MIVLSVIHTWALSYLLACFVANTNKFYVDLCAHIRNPHSSESRWMQPHPRSPCCDVVDRSPDHKRPIFIFARFII
jgi:hypothetical protein